MQVLACWGGQVCMKGNEYMGSTPTRPENREEREAVRWGRWTASEMKGWEERCLAGTCRAMLGFASMPVWAGKPGGEENWCSSI